MSHESKCEGEHVPANHLRAVANPGTRSFPSQRVVGVSHLPNCLPRRSPVTICKPKKNKPNNNNGSKKTGSTCLFCSSLMGRRRRRRQRRSTLVWPKRRRRQLFKFGRVQKLCSLCLGPFTRHWQTPWASRESRIDSIGVQWRRRIGGKRWRWHWQWNWLRFRILATCHTQYQRASEHTLTLVCGLILMRHATVAACGEILNRTNCKRSG